MACIRHIDVKLTLSLCLRSASAIQARKTYLLDSHLSFRDSAILTTFSLAEAHPYTDKSLRHQARPNSAAGETPPPALGHPFTCVSHGKKFCAHERIDAHHGRVPSSGCSQTTLSVTTHHPISDTGHLKITHFAAAASFSNQQILNTGRRVATPSISPFGKISRANVVHRCTRSAAAQAVRRWLAVQNDAHPS